LKNSALTERFLNGDQKSEPRVVKNQRKDLFEWVVPREKPGATGEWKRPDIAAQKGGKKGESGWQSFSEKIW